MAAMIEAGEFIESADVHGNYYGTSKAAVTSVVGQHKICILDIDVQGVQSVKKASLDPEPRYIFIKPPSIEELEKRLRTRGTETEDKIQRRLAGAVAELKYANDNDGANFDLVIVNETLDKAYAELKVCRASLPLALG
jgi:guanylate kinase